VHCYAQAKNMAVDSELSTLEGKHLLDDLAEIHVYDPKVSKEQILNSRYLNERNPDYP